MDLILAAGLALVAAGWIAVDARRTGRDMARWLSLAALPCIAGVTGALTWLLAGATSLSRGDALSPIGPGVLLLVALVAGTYALLGRFTGVAACWRRWRARLPAWRVSRLLARLRSRRGGSSAGARGLAAGLLRRSPLHAGASDSASRHDDLLVQPGVAAPAVQPHALPASAASRSSPQPGTDERLMVRAAGPLRLSRLTGTARHLASTLGRLARLPRLPAALAARRVPREAGWTRVAWSRGRWASALALGLALGLGAVAVFASAAWEAPWPARGVGDVTVAAAGPAAGPMADGDNVSATPPDEPPAASEPVAVPPAVAPTDTSIPAPPPPPPSTPSPTPIATPTAPPSPTPSPTATEEPTPEPEVQAEPPPDARPDAPAEAEPAAPAAPAAAEAEAPPPEPIAPPPARAAPRPVPARPVAPAPPPASRPSSPPQPVVQPLAPAPAPPPPAPPPPAPAATPTKMPFSPPPRR